MGKMIYVVSIVLIILAVWIAGIFLWGDDISRMLNFGDLEAENLEGSRSGGRGDSENIFSGDSGLGGASGGGSLSEEIIINESCSLKPIPYSLKNFWESVNCLEQNDDGCVDVMVNCSVDIFNLDDSFSGEFEIRYALLDSSQNELEFKTLKGNVGFDESEKFMLGFMRSDIEGVSEDLGCFFSMIDVPRKQICK